MIVTMIGSQIYTILSSNFVTKKKFKGIYSSNNLPSLQGIDYPAAFVVNTDETSKPGEHWVAFFFKSENAIPEYFDSFGLPPLKPGFISFLKQKRAKYRYSTKTLQNLFSSACGEYTIYYIFHKCLGWSLRKILSKFSLSTIKNDAIVKDFVHKLICRCSLSHVLSTCQSSISMVHVVKKKKQKHICDKGNCEK